MSGAGFFDDLASDDVDEARSCTAGQGNANLGNAPLGGSGSSAAPTPVQCEPSPSPTGLSDARSPELFYILTCQSKKIGKALFCQQHRRVVDGMAKSVVLLVPGCGANPIEAIEARHAGDTRVPNVCPNSERGVGKNCFSGACLERGLAS